MSIRLGTQIVAGNAIVVPENIYLKTTYDGGTSGYRIWSDGYCEQWGYVTSSGFITFIKTYKDKYFHLSMQRHYTSNTAALKSDTNSANHNTVGYSTQFGSADGTGCYIHVTSECGNDGVVWKTSGYLAAGQY